MPNLVWQPGDTSLLFGTYSFWEGGFRWEATYAEQPASIQQSIAALEIVPAGPSCYEDNASQSLTVFGSGPPRDYYASCPMAADKCIDFPPWEISEAMDCTTLNALLVQLPCRACNGLVTMCTGSVAIGIDDGCQHGTGNEDDFVFTTTQPGDYILGSGEPSYCGGSMTLKDSSNNVLASWSSVCPTVTHTLPQVGTYHLEVEQVPYLILRTGP